MLRKKIALFLVTAMVLTTTAPATYAADTVVNNPQTVTSEMPSTSGGAITSDTPSTSGSAITSGALSTSGSAITSEGAITSGSAVTENHNTSGNEPAVKDGGEQDKTNQLPKAESEAPKLDAKQVESGMTVSTNLLSMTQEKTIDVSVDLGYTPDLKNLTWTFGGKPFEKWTVIKCIGKDGEGGKEETDNPFITFAEEPKIDGNKVVAKIKFGLPFGTNNLSARPYPRRIYPKLLGEYDLAVVDKSKNLQVKSKLKMNAFDSFHQQPEIKPAVEEIIAASKNAGKERYIEYAPLGKSAEGRDIPFVIFAKSQGDVETYQKGTLPMMLEHPEQLINSIEKGEVGKYKPVIWFNNIHSDESNGVDAQIDMLRELATQDKITFKSVSGTVKGKDKDGNDYGNVGTGDKEDKILDVNELLDNYIVLFSLNNNPDGRFHNSREMVSGFDPNRDVTYQTQVEMAAVFQAMAKWSPMIFNDFHGFQEDFLIEPCTPPHDPNFEYDLLMDSAVEHANAMGKAGIGMDGGYNHYIIPMFDMGQGWDDGAPMYAAVLSQMHGAVGHTVEIPELNQKSNDTFKYAGFGSLQYALDHKQKMFENQLKIYDRGIKGIDAKEVDEYLVNGKGESIGRPRGNNENFFPEYYVLPVDNQLQKNKLAAYEMAEYLIKNGVKVERTNTDVKIGEITYPKGSYIVPMHQAKRGFANCVLYDGSDFSDFSAMYAEVTMCFPALRGFDKYEIRVNDAFKGKTDSVEEVTIPTTDIPSGADQIVIKNTNNDAIKAVNELLADNKTVYMSYSKGDGFTKGDFIVAKKDLESIKNKYFLETEALKEKATVKTIKQPKVYGSGNELIYVLKELGFNLVDSYDNADVIADETGEKLTEAMENKIKAGTSYVGVGGYGVSAMADSGLLPGLEMGNNGDYYEGVLKAVLDTDSVITGRYSQNDYLYNNSASWIEKVPTTAKVLANISDKDDFYTAGWWPKHDEVKGKAYIIQDQAGNGKITLFASHIANKAHPSHQFRMLANAIYDGSMPSDNTGGGSHKKHNGGSKTKDTTTPTTPVKDPTKDQTKDPAKDPAKDTESKTMPSDTKNHWAESSVKELINLGAVSSYPDHTFKPDKNITRAELVTILVKALKINVSSDKVFADTQKHWAKDYIAAAEKYGIVSGYTANQFGPDDYVTREQLATMIMRAIKLNPQAAKEIFGDQKQISDWAKDYISAAQNAKLISGYPDGTFHPKASATRGEAAKVIVNAIKSTNNQ